MGAYKDLTTQDVTVTPFNVNKLFSFIGTITTDPTIGIEFYRGIKPSSSYNFKTLDTGITYKKNSGVLYYNIKQLYYSNYFSSPSGSDIPLPVKIPGVLPEYDVYVGDVKAPYYDNYIQTSLPQERYFPEATGSEISIISIPSKLYGDYIVPKSFRFLYPKLSPTKMYLVRDDGEGNLKEVDLVTSAEWRFKDSNSNTLEYFTSLDIANNSTGSFEDIECLHLSKTAIKFIGDDNIDSYVGKLNFCLTNFPEKEIILDIVDLVDSTNYGKYKVTSYTAGDPRFFIGITYDSHSGELTHKNPYRISYTIPGEDKIIGHIFYSHGVATFTSGTLATSSLQVSSSLDLICIEYSSSVTIYENQYKCNIRENEFQYSLNPTLVSSSIDNTYYTFATGSDFKPYVTCIGLYNSDNELMAVGKMAQPIPLSTTTDTTFQINFDFSFIKNQMPFYTPTITSIPEGGGEGCSISGCSLEVTQIEIV